MGYWQMGTKRGTGLGASDCLCPLLYASFHGDSCLINTTNCSIPRTPEATCGHSLAFQCNPMNLLV